MSSEKLEIVIIVERKITDLWQTMLFLGFILMTLLKLMLVVLLEVFGCCGKKSIGNIQVVMLHDQVFTVPFKQGTECVGF